MFKNETRIMAVCLTYSEKTDLILPSLLEVDSCPKENAKVSLLKQ